MGLQSQRKCAQETAPEMPHLHLDLVREGDPRPQASAVTGRDPELSGETRRTPGQREGGVTLKTAVNLGHSSHRDVMTLHPLHCDWPAASLTSMAEVWQKYGRSDSHSGPCL